MHERLSHRKHPEAPRQSERPKIEISVPDLPNPKAEGKHVKTVETQTNLEHEGTRYQVQVIIERFQDRDLERQSGGPVAKVEVYLQDPTTGEDVSTFKAALNHGGSTEVPRDMGASPPMFWRIYTRLVYDTNKRGAGIGKLTLATMEDTMREVARAMDVQPEWIEIRTKLGALANMIVDREWLAQMMTGEDVEVSDHARERLGEKGMQEGWFAYQPIESQSQAAVDLLQQRTQQLHDADGWQEEVVFVRALG